MCVDVSPASQPLPFVEPQVRLVGSILSTHEVLQAHDMVDGELRAIQVDGPTALLGVDEGLSRADTESHLPLRGTELGAPRAVGELDEAQLPCLLVALPFQ